MAASETIPAENWSSKSKKHQKDLLSWDSAEERIIWKTSEFSNFCARSAFFYFFLLYSPPKFNAQYKFKSHSLNCDRLNYAAPDKADLIWMVTLDTLENKSHYNNKKQQTWEEE